LSWQEILKPDDVRLYKENISLLEDQVIQKFPDSYKDPDIVAAIRKVPRHFFVNQRYKHLAYSDNAFPTCNGMTTSAPSVIAKMIYYTGVKKGDRVLEIGTGTGYQAAVLSEMGIHVFSFEIDKAIIKTANKILVSLGYKIDQQVSNEIKRKEMIAYYNKINRIFPGRGKIRLFYGNGQKGLEPYAPFHGIIIAAALSHLKHIHTLIQQLSPSGGRLIVPVGDRIEQQMHIIEKNNRKIRIFVLKRISFQFVRMVLKDN
jgi:protein-L-isoaspartate(D-aspartate) O-methyltransferase